MTTVSYGLHLDFALPTLNTQQLTEDMNLCRFIVQIRVPPASSQKQASNALARCADTYDPCF